jgi:hypothetical protein
MVTESLRSVFAHEGIGLIPSELGTRQVLSAVREEAHGPVERVILAELATRSGKPISNDSSPRMQTPAGEEKFETVFRRLVSLNTLPVLASHVIDGRAVLPMALMLEWLAEGALQRHPGLIFRGINDLRLLKGLILRDQESCQVSIRVGKGRREGKELVVPVELGGASGGHRPLIHVRGEAVLAETYERSQRRLVEGEPLRPYPHAMDHVYGGLLFHGPLMQALQEIEGSNATSIAARATAGPPPSSWIQKPLRQAWITDPLAIDAAFQMVVLWCREHGGANSLPTSIGQYRQYQPRFPASGVRMRAKIVHASRHRAVCDIELSDGQSDVVARIEKYECVIDGSLNESFRRNRLDTLEVASI